MIDYSQPVKPPPSIHSFHGITNIFYPQVLVYLKGFREGDRVRLARCVAMWTIDSLLDPKVLATLLQDHLVKDGLAADFICEVS